MMMKKKALSLSMLVMAVLLLVSSPALADSISLTLSSPAQTGVPGSTLTFGATVSAPIANGATVFLNGDSFNVDIAGPNPIDDSGFLLNFPLSLDPGGSFSGTLFTVALPANLASGMYDGFFTILGGANSLALDELATVSFQISTPSQSAVPEPGSWVLLASGLGVLAAGIFGCRCVPRASAA
jgi:hypothetical protein